MVSDDIFFDITSTKTLNTVAIRIIQGKDLQTGELKGIGQISSDTNKCTFRTRLDKGTYNLTLNGDIALSVDFIIN